jgi:hypothetical protein
MTDRQTNKQEAGLTAVSISLFTIFFWMLYNILSWLGFSSKIIESKHKTPVQNRQHILY